MCNPTYHERDSSTVLWSQIVYGSDYSTTTIGKVGQQSLISMTQKCCNLNLSSLPELSAYSSFTACILSSCIDLHTVCVHVLSHSNTAIDHALGGARKSHMKICWCPSIPYRPINVSVGGVRCINRNRNRMHEPPRGHFNEQR